MRHAICSSVCCRNRVCCMWWCSRSAGRLIRNCPCVVTCCIRSQLPACHAHPRLQTLATLIFLFRVLRTAPLKVIVILFYTCARVTLTFFACCVGTKEIMRVTPAIFMSCVHVEGCRWCVQTGNVPHGPIPSRTTEMPLPHQSLSSQH
jgi:hypothetical protein